MEYCESSVLTLISHIHTISTDFTNRRLAVSKEGNFVSSHGYILYMLSQKETMTMGEVSEAINRNKSTTTALIKKLQEVGLIQIEISKDDSRKKYISLTAKGKKFNTLTASISTQLLETCYRDFTEEEKKELVRLLLKMNKNIEEKN